MEGRTGRAGDDRPLLQPPLQRPRPRHASRAREPVRLQGHLPRGEEGAHRGRRLPGRAGGHLRRRRHPARRRGLPGVDGGRLLRVPARRRRGHRLGRLPEDRPRRGLQGRQPRRRRHRPLRREERLVRQGRLPAPRHPAAVLRALREVALRLPQQRVRPDRRLVRLRRQLLRLGPEPEAHRRVEQDGLRPGGHVHQPPLDADDEGLQPVRRRRSSSSSSDSTSREGHDPPSCPSRGSFPRMEKLS